jgi:hypothetical protein
MAESPRGVKSAVVSRKRPLRGKDAPENLLTGRVA